MPENSPGHGGWYIGSRGTECLDIIDQFDLGYCKGNALEYLLRAGRKPDNDEQQDLRKAIFYLQQRIRDIDRDMTDLDMNKPSVRDWERQYRSPIKDD